MVAQWKALLPHSSRVLGLLLSLGYCLCGVSVHVLWCSHGFPRVFQFPPGFLTSRPIGYTKLPLSENGLHRWIGVPSVVNSPTFHQTSRDWLWLHHEPDQDKKVTDRVGVSNQLKYFSTLTLKQGTIICLPLNEAWPLIKFRINHNSLNCKACNCVFKCGHCELIQAHGKLGETCLAWGCQDWFYFGVGSW